MVKTDPNVSVLDLSNQNRNLAVRELSSGDPVVKAVYVQLGGSQVMLTDVLIKDLVAYANKQQLEKGSLLTEEWLLAHSTPTAGPSSSNTTISNSSSTMLDRIVVVCHDSNPVHLAPSNLRVVRKNPLDEPQPQLPGVCFAAVAPPRVDSLLVRLLPQGVSTLKLCGQPAMAAKHTCSDHELLEEDAAKVFEYLLHDVFSRYLKKNIAIVKSKQQEQQEQEQHAPGWCLDSESCIVCLKRKLAEVEEHIPTILGERRVLRLNHITSSVLQLYLPSDTGLTSLREDRHMGKCLAFTPRGLCNNPVWNYEVNLEGGVPLRYDEELVQSLVCVHHLLGGGAAAAMHHYRNYRSARSGRTMDRDGNDKHRDTKRFLKLMGLAGGLGAFGK
jgi:hypothetical protein